jgi:hypothetical protein
MLKKLPKVSNIKKKIFLTILILIFQIPSSANDIRNFQIEGMSIGDSALNYFSETQLENGELGWYNYTHKEYSTSVLPGKGIYNWFKISYKSNDDNFSIEGLIGIVKKNNYDDKKCNNQLNSIALDISKLFENIIQSRKQSYKIAYNPRKIFYPTDPLGKSEATTISFNFSDERKIILACYDIDKKTNEIKSNITDINQFDSFRIDMRSREFINYLKDEAN